MRGQELIKYEMTRAVCYLYAIPLHNVDEPDMSFCHNKRYHEWPLIHKIYLVYKGISGIKYI